jgi:hypothetical protein
MRAILVTLAMLLVLGSTALARPSEPEPGTPAQQPAVTTDLRAPDQVAPMQHSATGPDLRAPDQVAPMQHSATGPDLRAPDQVAPATRSDLSKAHQLVADAPTAPSNGGLAAIVFVLIGLGAALVLLAGGYLGVRYRHRVAIADDLVVH